MVPDIINTQNVAALSSRIMWTAGSTFAVGLVACIGLLAGLLALNTPSLLGAGAFVVGLVAVFSVAVIVLPVSVEMEVLEGGMDRRGRWGRRRSAGAGPIGIRWRFSVGASLDALFVAALLVALFWYGDAAQRPLLACVVGGSALLLALLLWATLRWAAHLAAALSRAIGPGEPV